MSPHQLRVLALVVLMAAAIVAVDCWLLILGSTSEVYPLLVVQVALFGFVSGRFVASWLKWVLFVWMLVLIDVILFGAVPGHRSGLEYTVFAGQFSALVIWTALGSTRWPWRLPGVLVTSVLIVAGTLVIEKYAKWSAGAWLAIILCQGATVLAACLIMRYFGLSVRRLTTASDSPVEDAVEREYQFSLLHMLAWMTAVAIAVLLSQGFDVRMFDYIKVNDVPAVLAFGLVLGIGSLVTMWSTLGIGHRVTRLSALLAIAVTVGFPLQWLTTWWVNHYGGQWSTNLSRHHVVRIVSEFDGGWVAWYPLSVFFLAALLVIFRASGYRLATWPPTDRKLKGVADQEKHDAESAP